MSLVKIANKLPKLNGKFFGVYVLPPIPTYKITLFPSQNGSISADTLEGIEGTLVTLSNTPDTHYSFGGYGITGATLTGNQFLIGQDDISVQGSFIEDAKYSLSLTQTTGGSINANKNTGYAGDIITLSNTPSSHYSFNGYSITGATLTGNQFAFGSQNVTAKGTFVEDQKYSVILDIVEGGTITANPTTGYAGDTITLSNTANAGYTFSNYTITGGTLTGNKFILTNEDPVVQANFTHNVYNLTLQTDGHGYITANKLTGYYKDYTPLSNTPSAGYAFNNYTVTGGTISSNSFVFGTSNGTAKANFTALPVRTITLTQQSNGTITASPMTGYDGDIITLSNTAATDYTLSGYSITGATLTGNQFRLNGNNVTVKGTFKRNTKDFFASGYYWPAKGYDYQEGGILINRNYYYQNLGYMAITSAVNLPADWITYTSGISALTPDTENYTHCSGKVYNSNIIISSYYANSNNNPVAIKSQRNDPWNVFYLRDADDSYVPEPKASAYSASNNVVYIGGKVYGNKYSDYSNKTVTYSALPSKFIWQTMVSSSPNDWRVATYNMKVSRPGVNNVWVMSGTYDTPKTVRTLTLTQSTGGTLSSNTLTGYEGTVVNLFTTPSAGYSVTSYSITGATLTGTQFTLSSSNVTAKANFKHDVYTLTLQKNGQGKIVAGKTTGYYNDTTTLTATPSANYYFNGYYTTGGSININTFRWGEGNATAKADFVSGISPSSYSKYIKVHSYLWTIDPHQQYMLSSNKGNFSIAYYAKDNNTDMQFYDANHDYGSYVTTAVSPVWFTLCSPDNQNADIIFRLYSTATNPQYYFGRTNHVDRDTSYTATSLNGPWTLFSGGIV